MRLALSALAALSLALVPPAAAQSDTQEVTAVVKRLFDAMRSGDSAGVRSVFHPEVRFASVGVRNGVPQFTIDSLDAFVRAIGKPHPQVYDERTSNEVVHIDGPLAVVWADYEFYLGDKFSHCGVDTFQLFHGQDGWKIVALADTRRREGCKAAGSH
jgi:hypothetical protein